MLGNIFKLIGRHFMACWAPFRSKKMSQKKREISCDSTLTRVCKPMTRQFSSLDSDSTRPSHDSDSTRKNFGWLWLEGLVTLTRQKWLGHITDICVFLFTAMLVKSLAFCVWEWRRYTIQYKLLWKQELFFTDSPFDVALFWCGT